MNRTKLAALLLSLALGTGLGPVAAAPETGAPAHSWPAPGATPDEALGISRPYVYVVGSADGRPEMLVQHFAKLDDASGEPPASAAVPRGAIVGVSDGCPNGWLTHDDTDGNPLYLPFGLLVDREGNPKVPGYGLLYACAKQ